MYLVSVFLLCVVTLSLQNPTKDGVKCECMKSIKCKYWVSAVRRGKYLDLPVCGYDHQTLAPLLCCPSGDVNWVNKANRTKREVQSLQGLENIQLSCTVTSHHTSQESSPAQIANQKCAEYGKLIFQSLYHVSVGGSPFRQETLDTCARHDEEDEQTATPREFPHMVSTDVLSSRGVYKALIGYGEEDIEWQCSGSLISERFILSAAICSNRRQYGLAKWAKLGDLDVSTDVDVARPQHYKISERIVHPKYKVGQYYHDIALFKLDRDVTFNIFVRPACLFTRRDPPDNKADATGWGRKTYDGEPSKTLKKVKMDLVTTEDCNKVYNETYNSRLPQGIQDDTIICAKETEEDGVYLCSGDGGGPLQIPLKKPYCMYGIIGLTSFGKLCGVPAPSGFTRVTHYVPWIVEKIWSE